jgi:uncharacterized protein YkwD
VALAAFALAGTSELFGRAHGPKGRLLVARPTLVWEVWSTDPREIVGARAVIGGRTVKAEYDAVLKRVEARPSSPLPPGEHSATLYAVLRDGETISKSWTFRVASGAIEELPPANESQYRTLAIINGIRRDMGLAPARMDPSLNASSMLHTRYHQMNNSTGHYQDSKKPGYIGHEPWERHEALGWVGDSWETVSYGTDSEEDSIQSLVDAPYHRLPYMQPGEILVGSGYAKNRMTVAFSMSRATSTVLYPFDGQRDVPTSWDGRERPDPFRIHPASRTPSGYPLMLAHFNKDRKRLSVRSARLFDEQGIEVPCWLNTPANDSELFNALILIPRAPLQPNTGYMVRVEASAVGGPDVSKIWRFQTASRAGSRVRQIPPRAAAKRP